MTRARPFALPEPEGCAYLNGHVAPCGAPCRCGSPYCGEHHALTHLRRGSKAEQRKINKFASAARTKGGARWDSRWGLAPIT